jgi:hypothetical protein
LNRSKNLIWIVDEPVSLRFLSPQKLLKIARERIFGADCGFERGVKYYHISYCPFFGFGVLIVSIIGTLTSKLRKDGSVWQQVLAPTEPVMQVAGLRKHRCGEQITEGTENNLPIRTSPV